MMLGNHHYWIKKGAENSLGRKLFKHVIFQSKQTRKRDVTMLIYFISVWGWSPLKSNYLNKNQIYIPLYFFSAFGFFPGKPPHFVNAINIIIFLICRHSFQQRGSFPGNQEVVLPGWRHDGDRPDHDCSTRVECVCAYTNEMCCSTARLCSILDLHT